jgi:hypothetical protein
MALFLVTIGMVLLLLGLIGGSNVPLILVGLAIMVFAGVLQMRIARRT